MSPKSITIVNCIVILGIRYFNMGNEVSNAAVSSVSAEATGKPESGEKLYKFRNPTLVNVVCLRCVEVVY